MLLIGTSSARAGSFYDLCLAKELSISAVALSMQLWGQHKLTQQEPADLSAVKLLPWDKPFAGTSNGTADLFSDLLLLTGLTPGYLALKTWERGESSKAITQIVMLSELLLLNSGLNLWVRSHSFWPRPYVWKKENNFRPQNEAYGSFYSGHAAGAFATAVFTATWYARE
ncbi:MAG: phosphatase PAP2 family protein, partial [Fibrobacter sp.]|nr:phosphatase PAP2 family protein [Fibrobacter sp.]